MSRRGGKRSDRGRLASTAIVEGVSFLLRRQTSLGTSELLITERAPLTQCSI